MVVTVEVQVFPHMDGQAAFAPDTETPQGFAAVDDVEMPSRLVS